MLRYQRPNILSKNNFVNVRFHPGAITEDSVDFNKPVIRKKPPAVVRHVGTNDLTNSKRTWSTWFVKIAKTIQEMKSSGKMGIGFSIMWRGQIEILKIKLKRLRTSWKDIVRVMASFMWIMIKELATFK